LETFLWFGKHQENGTYALGYTLFLIKNIDNDAGNKASATRPASFLMKKINC